MPNKKIWGGGLVFGAVVSVPPPRKLPKNTTASVGISTEELNQIGSVAGYRDHKGRKDRQTDGRTDIKLLCNLRLRNGVKT